MQPTQIFQDSQKLAYISLLVQTKNFIEKFSLVAEILQLKEMAKIKSSNLNIFGTF
jgi:hypothetical protein